MQKLPRHIAVIMDGNGRWAEQRKLPRVAGHKVGAESVKAIVELCVEHGIEVLTLYAFSVENWQRPAVEVNFLMKLLCNHLAAESLELHRHNIALRVIGSADGLDADLQDRISKSQQLMQHNTGLKLVIAFNYSGWWDIVEATKKIGSAIECGRLKSSDINVETLQQHICLHDLPPPDLLIRTSGEQRLSNFMLWQLAYTEFYFTHVLWPDFRKEAFLAALDEYAKRSRRFGTIV